MSREGMFYDQEKEDGYQSQRMRMMLHLIEMRSVILSLELVGDSASQVVVQWSRLMRLRLSLRIQIFSLR